IPRPIGARNARRRRQWAHDAGLPVDETEDFFKDLIHWFINQQITHWRVLHPEAQP
ncbi:isochorismate-pyruvate lyase, partial [Pseudomonas syringae pv. actinidiae]|nr:isochorismate-pyruvate lyase [Pseudomonas syringae pv. actinidiae]